MIWHQESVEALVRDLALAELRVLRPGSRLSLQDLQGDFLFEHHVLKLDSLEIFHIATQVAVFFELHETDSEQSLLEDVGLSDWIERVIESRRQHDASVTFATSGSTGQPKFIQHELSLLNREAAHWATVFNGRTEVSGNVPRHHIYGFIFTVLLPEQLAMPYVDLRPALPMNCFARGNQGRLLITLPNVLQSFVGLGDLGLAADDGLQVVTSTAPSPHHLHEQAQQLGVQDVFHIYGSSETRGVGMRRTGLEYQPLPFIEMDDDGDLCYRHTSGHTEKLPLQDQLEFNERGFLVLRRIDRMVQVGGYNVSLDGVARKLEAHPGISEALVRPLETSAGLRLKAFVVANFDLNLDDFVVQHLTAEERPVHIMKGAELPRGDNGKLCDWQVSNDDTKSTAAFDL